jgi:very-short-patch-repair endonuclease
MAPRVLVNASLCVCGNALSVCPKCAIPTPDSSSPYSYRVRDPKSGYYPGSLAHEQWKKDFRDKLRQNPTEAERTLRVALASDLRTVGRFEFQPIVLGFIPDFASVQDRLIIEVDGSVHTTTHAKRADARRDNIFRRNGWVVKRFSNNQVRDHLPDVLRIVISAVQPSTRASGIAKTPDSH